MLHTRAFSLRRLHITSSRWISGYKINAENYERPKHEDNFTDQDVYEEKIKLAAMNKSKSPLYGFDTITEEDLRRRKFAPNPNAPFLENPDIPPYRSIHKYMKFAERERRRQRAEGVQWRTLDQWFKQQFEKGELINIGYKLPSNPGRKLSRKELQAIRKSDPQLERSSRERTLTLDMDEISQNWERSHTGIEHINKIAHHYNIYKDLFGNAEFFPVMHMDVDYECIEDRELANAVYYGNELLPSETELPPTVFHDGPEEKLYTVLLTNPDEHLENNDREYVHWLVGNIPGRDVASGETLVDYLRPFPARGTGYQRMVFILFAQIERIDYSSAKRGTPCLQLSERDFKTFDFYRQHEDRLTPASLRFFQCKWEDTVKDTFHKILNMPEPVYEYAKLTEKPRLSRLKRTPNNKTLTWLSNFFPKEPTYPDNSPEERMVRREVAREATAYKTPNRGFYPIKTVYQK